MSLKKEKEVFGNNYDAIKSIVIVSGPMTLETPMLSTIVTSDRQIQLLQKIVSDADHPWMKEYRHRINSLEQNIAKEQYKKSQREKNLLKSIRTQRWRRLTFRGKVYYIIKKTLFNLIFYTVIFGMMIIFFMITLDGLR